MARDIAFVADKDTRDDLNSFSPGLPVHDVPRSEGRAAGDGPFSDTSSEPTVSDGQAVLRDEEASAFAAEDAAEDPPLPAPSADGAAMDFAVPEPMPPPQEEPREEPALQMADGAAAVPQDEGAAWRSAIADALAEPPGPPPPDPPLPSPAPPDRPEDLAGEPERLPEEAPPAAPPAPVRAPIELLPQRPAPRIVAPPAEPAPSEPEPAAAPTAGAPDAPSATPQPDTFTAAAEGLFRPPQDGERDPHLITIGRRLDPGLRIPRPTAPVIAPHYEPDPEPRRPTWNDGTWQDRAWIVARYAAYAAAGYLALVIVLLVLFRFINPPGSMLMLTKLVTGNSVHRTWVPLAQISPTLVRAVIVSEDGRFCAHSGVDTVAIREAIERASGGTPRGASTISMQVTKNLFLWNAKSYVRKVIEIPLTLAMEIIWPKRRILEVYLNIAEWGPGVFGAEAAARHHFNKPALRLNEREAALLAAVLPNPVVRNAGAPNTLTSRKARVVQSRVKAYGAIASCVVAGAAPATASDGGTPAASGGPAASSRAQPARKAQPQRRAPRRETIEDWVPTVRMGPQ